MDIPTIGAKFNRLTVISAPMKIRSRDMVECRCECGKTKAVRVWSLYHEGVKSCGCMKQEWIDKMRNITQQRHDRPDN